MGAPGMHGTSARNSRSGQRATIIWFAINGQESFVSSCRLSRFAILL